MQMLKPDIKKKRALPMAPPVANEEYSPYNLPRWLFTIAITARNLNISMLMLRWDIVLTGKFAIWAYHHLLALFLCL